LSIGYNIAAGVVLSNLVESQNFPWGMLWWNISEKNHNEIEQIVQRLQNPWGCLKLDRI